MQNSRKKTKFKLQSILNDISTNCKEYGESIEDIGDALLFIGCIDNGKNSNAHITIAGTPDRVAKAIFEAMKKEDGISKMILLATKMYMENIQNNNDQETMRSVVEILTDVIFECPCPRCTQRRKDQGNYN